MGAIECGVSRRVMRELEEAFSTGKWGEVAVRVREGRGTGILFLAAWMLSKVSPLISGNYHVFSGAGNYPRRRSRPRGETRKGLRRWINRAIRAGIIEEIRKPRYVDRPDAHPGDPPNAAPNPTERLDIPLIGWQFIRTANHSVLVPKWWRDKSHRSQIHPTSTYRLNNDSSAETITALIELGELILDKNQLEDKLQPETAGCWKNLKSFLENQHHDMMAHYEFAVQHADVAFDGVLERTAMALYLASSLIRLWPPSWVIPCTEAVTMLKGTPTPAAHT